MASVGPAELKFIMSVIWIVFLVGVIIVIDKVRLRNAAKKDLEMEQIRQEMAEMRERMDKQYADLTLMLEDLRGKQQRQTNREA